MSRTIRLMLLGGTVLVSGLAFLPAPDLFAGGGKRCSGTTPPECRRISECEPTPSGGERCVIDLYYFPDSQ